MDSDILSMNHCERRRCESWKVRGGRECARECSFSESHVQREERVCVSAVSVLNASFN